MGTGADDPASLQDVVQFAMDNADMLERALAVTDVLALPPMLKLGDVAEFLRLETTGGVVGMIERGELAGGKNGRSWLVPRGSLAQHVLRNYFRDHPQTSEGGAS